MCLYIPFYIIALLSFNYKVQFCVCTTIVNAYIYVYYMMMAYNVLKPVDQIKFTIQILHGVAI
jgi:hypothetical protein